MGRLLPAFMGHEPLLKAHVRYQLRTCGNKGCRCARGEPHGAWIVQTSHRGRARCRSVSVELYEKLQTPAQAYRRWRQARADWNRLAKQVQQVLGRMELLRSVDLEKLLEER
jgi:hypothetical protein